MWLRIQDFGVCVCVCAVLSLYLLGKKAVLFVETSEHTGLAAQRDASTHQCAMTGWQVVIVLLLMGRGPDNRGFESRQGNFLFSKMAKDCSGTLAV
jgi:hypothetical protein